MQTTFLSSIVIVFGLSIAVLFICYRLRIPSIVGFLLTGMLAGPYGLRLINESRNVETLAQIGVVLLLFTIGLEFSLKNLISLRKSFFIGGSLQVVLTIIAACLISMKNGRSFAESLTIGFVLSLSSTAIVLKRLQEKAEMESPHGRFIVGILIYQDIIVVPMMLLLPFFSGEQENLGASIGIFILKIAILGIAIAFGIKWVVPRILFQIAKTRSREVFLLSIIVLCFSVAWFTSSIGLSLALGAFLAGLIISESEYKFQAFGSILPFRDVFSCIFFISIGMLFDWGYFFENPITILLLTFGVIVLKTIVAGIVPGLLGFPLRTMALVGIALGQVGEFSFILLQTGYGMHLITQEMYQTFLGVSILTMIVTPFIMASGNSIATFLLNLPLPEKVKLGYSSLTFGIDERKKKSRNDHLVIIGYGMNGRNLARAAKVAGISYVILEMNPETVKNEKARGEPIFYGDATHDAVLLHLDITHARVVVVAIPDPVATRRVVETLRRLNPIVHIIARTRFFQEMKPLYELGANEVIPEEFETSVEIFTRVLLNYLVPHEKIEKFIGEIRSDGYQMFRSYSKESSTFSDLKLALPDMQITSLHINSKSTVPGRTLSEIDLRKKFGVSLLAIRRGEEILANPSGETRLLEDDVLVILGKPENTALVSYLVKD
jgi:monovalent cation:H+ antiporter-2, CPA2 family